MVFAFLYGLSMDYEVFILSRMREEYDRDGSTDRAVVAGLARTGRLVTAGSLILFLAFIALASAPGTDIKVFATGAGHRHPAGRDDRAQHAAAGLRRRCSAAGTGGCRRGRRASCGWSRASRRPRRAARSRWIWSRRSQRPQPAEAWRCAGSLGRGPLALTSDRPATSERRRY